MPYYVISLKFMLSVTLLLGRESPPMYVCMHVLKNVKFVPYYVINHEFMCWTEKCRKLQYYVINLKFMLPITLLLGI